MPIASIASGQRCSLRQRRERGRQVVDDLGWHDDARRLRLAVQRANAEQRRQRPDVIGVAVRQQDRVDAAERARRDPGVEHEASSGTASDV